MFESSREGTGCEDCEVGLLGLVKDAEEEGGVRGEKV